MDDDDLIKQIMAMTMPELLEFIICNDEYLSDSYYREFGEAIRKRAKELLS